MASGSDHLKTCRWTKQPVAMRIGSEHVRAFVDAVRAGRTCWRPAMEEQPGEANAALAYEYGGGPPVADPQVLEITDGAKWLEPDASSCLYVRPAYRVLLMLATAFLDQEDEDSGRSQVLVTGAFGVGKTAFLNFVLAHMCVAEHAPVIVLDMCGVFCRVGPDGVVVEGKKGESFMEELALRSTIYLCDATADASSWPLVVAARTIATSAPIRRCYDAMDRATSRKTVTFIMPLWTTAELETCRVACFPQVPREHLVELVHLWGGTARWTLGTPLIRSKDRFVRGASELPLHIAARLVQDHGIAVDDVLDDGGYSVDGHQVVHMDVGADNMFKLESVQLCSSTACALLLQSKANQHVDAAFEVDEVVKDRAGDVFRRQIQQELLNRTALE